MSVLVITGGIGSGKSQVCNILRENGYDAQYNADAKVKELYLSHPGLLGQIEERLDCVLHDENGSFVPSRLSGIIFSEPQALNVVESIVLPVLAEDFAEFVHRHADSKVVIFESATVLDKPQFEGVADKVIVVDAPLELRLERACRRDGASREQILLRMKNQKSVNAISDGFVDKRVDHIIWNDGTYEHLRQLVEDAMMCLYGD